MDLNDLVAGAVYGLTLAIIAIAVPRYTRYLLAAGLVVAGLLYVGFALEARASAAWLVTEMVGVGIYGYAAMRGVRGSAWWLAGGWALHPVWSVALHNGGAGRAFAPASYTASALTFELAVAAITAIAVLIGTQLTAVPSAKPVVLSIRPSACTCGTCTCTATGARAA